jgi:hypothetical protein
MNRRWIASGLVTSAALFGTTEVRAQDANNFAQKGGQLILSADRLVPVFSFNSVSVRDVDGRRTDSVNGSSSSILWGGDVGFGGRNPHTIPRVGVDFTIIPRLTLGGAVALGFTMGGSAETEVVDGPRTMTTRVETPSVTAFGLAPRVGYVLPLGNVLAVWLRGGFAFYSVRVRTESVFQQGRRFDTESNSLFSLDVDPQLAIVPFEHFFFTVGPIINIPLTGTRAEERVTGAVTERTERDLSIFHFGVNAGLGGWFDL